ncbi:lipase family alpha/beta hydrolase [Polaribacter sp.]|uniref:lipase family alpha/beta hydrolase n=2 Tax=Polaribacter sp. TaxID=1920175 RepID=UPI0040483EC5
MKKITFCIILLILSLKMQAQLTNGSFTDEVDFRLQNISKTPITSNILIDRVFPVAALQIFNQGSRIDTSSYTHFKQSWSELYRASYTKNFISLEELKTHIQNKNYQENVIPLGIINTEFHQGNYGTTTQNATVDFNPTTGLFANKSGQNPFIKKQITIVAPLISKVIGSSIQFKTDNLFHLYKFGKQIKTLQLTTNGNNFTLISNYNLSTSNFVTNYTTSGKKDLHFTITFSDNTTKTTLAKVYVEIPTNYQAKSNVSSLQTIIADTDLAFQGYEAGDQPILGKNEYRIYYGNDNVLDKPLIIIDGFDPEDKRKIESTDLGHDKNQPSIRELMSYDIDNDPYNENNKDLIGELNLLGYDVIIVNHPVNKANGIDGGSDYIERNAFTLISLIRHINATKQGNDPNVIIGPSMGGLISRYALAYMEKKLAETGDNTKWNHETRLWVSFDSPHQGANIPIGVQKGIEYFAEEWNVESAQDFIDIQLNKPATKQMLVNHFTNNSNLPVGASNFRNRFQNELNQLGMPNNLRKVALINGSILGALNGVSKGKYLEIEDELEYLGIFGGLANIYADKLLAKFYHSTNTKSGNEEHFTFDGGLRGSFLGFTWWSTRTSFKSQPTSNGSYDVAPGGYFNAQQLLANESTTPSDEFRWYLLSWIFHDLDSTVFDPTHSFIPTKSALAYSGNTVLDEVIGDKNRVCSGNTPFDSYFAPENNEEHITLTAKNVDWLKKELNNNPQLPSVYKNFVFSSLSGDLAVCDTKTNIYNLDIPNTCSGFTITWTTSSNIQIQQSSNNSLTVTPINGTNDAIGFINAYVQELNLNIHKKVWVGIPSPNFLSINKVSSYEFYANQWTKLKVVHPVPPLELMGNDTTYGLSYQWLVPNSQIRTFTDTSTIDVNPYSTGQLNIGVKMQNQCGCTNYQYQLFNVSSSSTTNPGGGGILTPIGKM